MIVDKPCPECGKIVENPHNRKKKYCYGKCRDLVRNRKKYHILPKKDRRQYHKNLRKRYFEEGKCTRCGHLNPDSEYKVCYLCKRQLGKEV